MKHDAKKSEALLKALQDDGPSEADRARVRQKLLAAGLAVGGAGATVTTSSAAAAATAAGGSAAGSSAAGAGSAGAGLGSAGTAASGTVGAGTVTAASATAKVGLVAKLAALPAAVKVAATTGAVIAGVSLAAPEQPSVAPSHPGTAMSESTATDQAPHSSSHAVHRAQPAPPAPVPQNEQVAPSPLTPPSAPKPVARRMATPRAPQAAVSTLAVEARLIEGALSALHAGDARRAEMLLEEHALRFPQGLLARERETARAKVNLIQDTSLNLEGADDNAK